MCLFVSFLFESRWCWRLLGMLILFIGLAASEMLSGVLLIGITNTGLSKIQEDTMFYTCGSILSRVIALFLIKIFAIFWEKKRGKVGAVSTTVLFLPLISCFVICMIAWSSRFYDDIRFVVLGFIMITGILIANLYFGKL